MLVYPAKHSPGKVDSEFARTLTWQATYNCRVPDNSSKFNASPTLDDAIAL